MHCMCPLFGLEIQNEPVEINSSQFAPTSQQVCEFTKM